MPVLGTALRRAAARLRFTTTGIYSEMPDKERPALVEGRLQVGSIGRPTHTEIGKVVQVLPKKLLTIACVFSSVQDVGMPEFIDRARWADLLISIHDIESEENDDTGPRLRSGTPVTIPSLHQASV